MLALALALVSSSRSQALHLPVYTAGKEVAVLKRFHYGTQFQMSVVSGVQARRCHVKGRVNRNKSVLFDVKTRAM